MNNTSRSLIEWALRLSLSITFLFAVSSRLGLFSHDPNAWENFVKFTGIMTGFMPSVLTPFFAYAATACELAFGILLLLPVQTKWVARLAGALLLTFALSGTISMGISQPLGHSVFTAAAAAYALSYLVSEKKAAGK